MDKLGISTMWSEFINNPKGFKEWLKNNESEEFIKNLDKLIQKTRQDLILLIKIKNADNVLSDFEELIKPVYSAIPAFKIFIV